MKVEDLYKEKIDCIISTIHIPSGLPVPVIKVNSIFDDKEIKSIGQRLFTHVNTSVRPYIKEDLIFLNYSASTKEDVIQFLCEKALRNAMYQKTFMLLLWKEKIRLRQRLGIQLQSRIRCSY